MSCSTRATAVTVGKRRAKVTNAKKATDWATVAQFFACIHCDGYAPTIPLGEDLVGQRCSEIVGRWGSR